MECQPHNSMHPGLQGRDHLCVCIILATTMNHPQKISCKLAYETHLRAIAIHVGGGKI